MTSRLKTAALWLGVVFLIWAAVGLAWHGRAYEPSNSDLLLGLVGVPALLIAGYVVLKRVLGSMLRPSAPVAKEPGADAAATTPQGSTPAASPRVRLLVLGGSIKMPVGGAQELLQACTEGKRPELDGQLRDGQGFPVVAARVQELDAMNALEWWEGADLDAVLPQGRAWVAQLPAARARELRLLADVLADSAAAAERDLLHAAEQSSSASASLEKPCGMRQAPELPAIQVRLALEHDWGPDDWDPLQSWAQVWLERAAPALRFDVQRYLAYAAGELVSFPWPTALLDAKSAAFLRPSVEGGGCEEIWLLAAAHSGVSQPAVDELASTGRLYGPRRREGLIAGEGAAALVLLRQQPALGPAVLSAELQSPVVASAKVLPAAEAASALAQRVVVPVLDVCGVPSVTVGRVLSDADHRPAPAMEAAMLLAQQFPDLSLESDCAMIGVPCGHTAGVAALASLILAAEFSVAEQRVALALALAAEPWRAAALLMPPGCTDATDAEVKAS